ncbi:MAG: hypothetical protein KatS3mg099_429 [Candidatus Parcubacteria bacterium]|nr:MAG: hypothetical protein KatS3mg099_429 [Candidatus Parcubacteria bacterium]
MEWGSLLVNAVGMVLTAIFPPLGLALQGIQALAPERPPLVTTLFAEPVVESSQRRQSAPSNGGAVPQRVVAPGVELNRRPDSPSLKSPSAQRPEHQTPPPEVSDERPPSATGSLADTSPSRPSGPGVGTANWKEYRSDLLKLQFRFPQDKLEVVFDAVQGSICLDPKNGAYEAECVVKISRVPMSAPLLAKLTKGAIERQGSLGSPRGGASRQGSRLTFSVLEPHSPEALMATTTYKTVEGDEVIYFAGSTEGTVLVGFLTQGGLPVSDRVALLRSIRPVSSAAHSPQSPRKPAITKLEVRARPDSLSERLGEVEVAWATDLLPEEVERFGARCWLWVREAYSSQWRQIDINSGLYRFPSPPYIPTTTFGSRRLSVYGAGAHTIKLRCSGDGKENSPFAVEREATATVPYQPASPTIFSFTVAPSDGARTGSAVTLQWKSDLTPYEEIEEQGGCKVFVVNNEVSAGKRKLIFPSLSGDRPARTAEGSVTYVPRNPGEHRFVLSCVNSLKRKGEEVERVAVLNVTGPSLEDTSSPIQYFQPHLPDGPHQPLDLMFSWGATGAVSCVLLNPENKKIAEGTRRDVVVKKVMPGVFRLRCTDKQGRVFEETADVTWRHIMDERASGLFPYLQVDKKQARAGDTVTLSWNTRILWNGPQPAYQPADLPFPIRCQLERIGFRFGMRSWESLAPQGSLQDVIPTPSSPSPRDPSEPEEIHYRLDCATDPPVLEGFDFVDLPVK